MKHAVIIVSLGESPQKETSSIPIGSNKGN